MVSVAPPYFGPSRCRRCGRSIVWVQTEAGARVALETEAKHGAPYVLVTATLDGELVDEADQSPYIARRATPDDDPRSRWALHMPGACEPPPATDGGAQQ